MSSNLSKKGLRWLKFKRDRVVTIFSDLKPYALGQLGKTIDDNASDQYHCMLDNILIPGTHLKAIQYAFLYQSIVWTFLW